MGVSARCAYSICRLTRVKLHLLSSIYSPTSIIRTLDYLNSTHEENYEVKVQQGPSAHVHAHAYASRMQPCVRVCEFVLFDNTQASTMATGTSRKRKCNLLTSSASTDE